MRATFASESTTLLPFVMFCSVVVRRFGATKTALSVVLALFSVPGMARAAGFRCSRTEVNAGPSLNWTERQVSFGVSNRVSQALELDTDAVAAQIRAGFGTWSAVECSDLSMTFIGTNGGFQAGFNPNGLNDNVVDLREDWPFDPDAIALTFTAFRLGTGDLVDADILLNGKDHGFVIAERGCSPEEGQIDLQNVVAHEAGHFVGLDHPPQTPANEEATMFANAVSCETKKRTLADGDVEGLCTIYPRGQPTQPCYEPGSIGFEVIDRDDGFGGCGAVGSRSDYAILAIMLAGASIRRRKGIG